MVPLFLTFFCGLRGGGALGESVTCPQKGAEANCSAVPGKCDACESAVDRPILKRATTTPIGPCRNGVP